MIHSAKKSSRSTGPRRKSTETSGLLPTPRANKINSQSREDFTPNLAFEIETANSHLFSRGGSHASRLVPPEKEKELKMTATSGLKCLESFGRFRQNGLWARTFAALLIGMEGWYSTKCRLIWNLRATKSSRFYFQLAPSTLPTAGTEYGLLATPNTMDSMQPKTDKAILKEATVTRPGRSKFANLKEQIAYGIVLPTPQARDWKGGQPKRFNDKNHRNDLNDRVAMLPTYKTSDVGREGKPGLDSAEMRRHSPNTNAIVGAKTGLKLQAPFVEWMMGFPLGWTDLNSPKPSIESKGLKVSATRSSRRSQSKSSGR